MKQDYATHGNFLKMLSIVDTLRGILTEVESQTIRTIVRRHLIDFAVELGDAPAGMDALRPQTAAEAIAAKIAAEEEDVRQREADDRRRVEAARQLAEKIAAEDAEWEREAAEGASNAGYAGAPAASFVKCFVKYLNDFRRWRGTPTPEVKIQAGKCAAESAEDAVQEAERRAAKAAEAAQEDFQAAMDAVPPETAAVAAEPEPEVDADWAAVCVLQQKRRALRLPDYALGAGRNAYDDAISAGATRAKAELARFAAEDEAVAERAARNASSKVAQRRARIADAQAAVNALPEAATELDAPELEKVS